MKFLSQLLVLCLWASIFRAYASPWKTIDYSHHELVLNGRYQVYFPNKYDQQVHRVLIVPLKAHSKVQNRRSIQLDRDNYKYRLEIVLTSGDPKELRMLFRQKNYKYNLGKPFPFQQERKLHLCQWNPRFYRHLKALSLKIEPRHPQYTQICKYFIEYDQNSKVKLDELLNSGIPYFSSASFDLDQEKQIVINNYIDESLERGLIKVSHERVTILDEYDFLYDLMKRFEVGDELLLPFGDKKGGFNNFMNKCCKIEGNNIIFSSKIDEFSISTKKTIHVHIE